LKVILGHVPNTRNINSNTIDTSYVGSKTEMSEDETFLTLNAFRIPKVIHT